jgi:hypothetical protein
MTTALVAPGDSRWRTLVAEKIAPDATDNDIDYLAAVCRRLELTPFSSPAQIVLVPRYDKRLRRDVFRPQVTVDGRLALAVRTGQIVGIEGPQFTGARDAWTRNGVRIWVDLWDYLEEQKYPRAARYFVHVKGWVKPVNGTAVWQEFRQVDKQGELLPLWQQMPSVMLAKSALSLALRRSGVESLGPDVAVAYEGDSEDLAIPPGETPAPAAAAMPGRGGTNHQIADDDGTIFTCTCGQQFSSGGAYHRHRVEARHYDPPPDELYDSAPESTGAVDADQEPSYANPDEPDPGRPFDAP